MTTPPPPSPAARATDEAWLDRRAAWLLVGLAALLFFLRWLGPSNLTDNDQERPASYVADAVRNGHWLVQRDWTGDLTSKPPLYTWLAGLASLPLGLGLAGLYLPCALALAATALSLHRGTRAAAGPRVALVAGFFVLANPLSAKLVALARTDPVFTATVTLTAVLAFRAWQTGRGWIRVWGAASLATLTKGPLGILLGLVGLLGLCFERRPGPKSPRIPDLLSGLGVILFVAGGWFLLAWIEAGQPLIDKMLKAELVSHAVGEPGAVPGQGLVLAPAYFLGRFAPWSALAFFGLWEAWRRPASEPGARAWQRFAAAWLLFGLLVFGLASHQRGDLIAPLIPAGAVLAAFPVARWTAAWPARSLLAATAALGLAAAVGFQVQHATRNLGTFRETRGLQELATRFRALGGRPDELVHIDAPYALQFFLGTMRRVQPPAAAASALLAGTARYAAVVDLAALEQALGPGAGRLRTVVQGPSEDRTKVRIVALEAAPRTP